MFHYGARCTEQWRTQISSLEGDVTRSNTFEFNNEGSKPKTIGGIVVEPHKNVSLPNSNKKLFSRLVALTLSSIAHPLQNTFVIVQN